MLQPGALFGGRYRLVRELGRGGMGVVWQARNEAIAREVAIKLMAPALAASEVSLSRFFNEARICGSIRHPGVVDVLDLGRAPDGTPFLVMELLQGTSLEDLITRRGRLPPDLACQIVRDVATTVALAHERGVVHRDLKPANIFLHLPAYGAPVVKVLDFGISKVISGESSGHTTGTGGMLGTPSYMSPEHAGGRLQVDHRTDVYALGVILYEALTGKLPYEGPTVQAILIDIATREPTPITRYAPGLPPMLAQLVGDAMVRERERRVPSAGDLAIRLDAVVRTLGLRAQALTAGDIDPAAVGDASVPRRAAEMAATTPAPGASEDRTLQSAPAVVAPRTPAHAPIGTVSPVSSGKSATAPTRLGGQVALGAALTITVAIAWASWRAFSSRTPEPETGHAATEVTAPDSPPSASAEAAPPATADPASTGSSAASGVPASPTATASASPSVTASASSLPDGKGTPAHHGPKAGARKAPNGQGMWGYE